MRRFCDVKWPTSFTFAELALVTADKLQLKRIYLSIKRTF